MDNKLFRNVLVLGVLFLFLGISIVPATQLNNDNILNINQFNLMNTKKIYVDGSNIEGPWDGTIEHPYQFIQDGVNNTNEGDIVYVFKGIYYENVRVETKSIKLLGEDKNSTIIDGKGISSGIFVMSDNVHISGFTIKNSGFYDYIDGSKMESGGINSISNYNGYYNNILIDNSVGIILNQKDWTYKGEESCYNKIYNNIVKNNYRCGIAIFGDYDNQFTKFRFNNIYRNIVSYNSYNSVTGMGICIGALGCNDNNVYENQIFNNKDIGVGVWGFNNKIWRNNISNHDYGIYIALSFNTLIKKNNFIDNKCNAYFEDSFLNRWSSNYWYDWTGIGFYAIEGFFGIYDYEKYIKNYDLTPAKNPYQIPNSYHSLNIDS